MTHPDSLSYNGTYDNGCVDRSKAKNAQEAHEAIRPTKARLLPQISGLAPASQLFRLYALVWARALACQMSPAQLLQVLLNDFRSHTFNQRNQTMLLASMSTSRLSAGLSAQDHHAERDDHVYCSVDHACCF